MKRLFLVGAGGFGRELFSTLLRSPESGRDWALEGFLDANPKALDGYSYPLRVVGDPMTHPVREGDLFALAIADPASKVACVASLKSRGAEFLTYVDPSARVFHGATIGEGCILCPNTAVSCDVTLGSFVVVNSSTSVGHDARVGDYTTLSSYVNITRSVQIGARVFIAGHSTFVPGVVIEDESVVGLGSIVMRRVRKGTTVFGNPARVISTRETGS